MTFSFRGNSFLILAVIVALAAVPVAAQQSAPQRPIIVFMTDFGTQDDAVPICKGVMLGIAPEVRIIDLTHQVTPFSIADGARFLFGTTPYYPAGTVFVVVIDPGVGTSRKAIVAKSRRGQYFVLPDNGLMTMVEDRDGIEGAREITNKAWMIGSALSSTFHGRDIFSPVGAHLARGDDWTQVGPELKELVRLPIAAAKVEQRGISGEVIALDGPFGNLITNISGEEFRKLGYEFGDTARIKLGSTEMTLPFARTFGDVPVGKPLLFIDSRGRLSLAVNQRNFAQTYKISPPVPLFISRK
ncbi:MAG TPA: S-adenosyl-l-methionine hydroxide adenosyltransferase family protein [Terriglobales bacterium]|nr:S-adenosyl-l-methionine hydroxide adenosyltransferase family protein [Terriglobales bacterium]